MRLDPSTALGRIVLISLVAGALAFFFVINDAVVSEQREIMRALGHNG